MALSQAAEQPSRWGAIKFNQIQANLSRQVLFDSDYDFRWQNWRTSANTMQKGNAAG